MKYFREHKGLNLSDINKDILQYWEENNVFHSHHRLLARAAPHDPPRQVRKEGENGKKVDDRQSEARA